MKCPKCKSLDVVETIQHSFSSDFEYSELQGYVCDKCDHEWSVKDKK